MAAVNDFSLTMASGEVVGLVGESGSGKSVTALAILRLLPLPPACNVSGSIRLDGTTLLDLSEGQLRKVRGKEIAMVFQEPMTALNPTFTIGDQSAKSYACTRDLAGAPSAILPWSFWRAWAYRHLNGGSTTIRTSSRVECGSGL